MYVYDLGAQMGLQFRPRRRRCPKMPVQVPLWMEYPGVSPMAPHAGIVCMPLAVNVWNMPNAHLVNCPRCGDLCWRRDAQSAEATGLIAACTRCALRAGMPR